MVVTGPLARFSACRGTFFADELPRSLVEADDGPTVICGLGMEREDILYARDGFGIGLRDAPYLLLPGLSWSSPARCPIVSSESESCAVRLTI